MKNIEKKWKHEIVIFEIQINEAIQKQYGEQSREGKIYT